MKARQTFMPKILITDFLEQTEIETPLLSDVAEIQIAAAETEDDLRDLLPTADVMIVYHDISRISRRSLELAARCKGIVRAGVGFNNVDVEAAGSLGIVVCNVPDYGTEEVADHAIMLLIGVARRLGPCDRQVRKAGWDYHDAIGTPRLRNKSLGVVGCGRIGSATALRAKALGMDVVVYDPFVPQGVEKALGVRRSETLASLLEQSLFVSIHCYLDESTHHLIGAREIGLMPEGSYLINTARGPIVDQNAMIEALQNGKLAGAGLDVFENEPLDDDRLRAVPNVLLTPHSAFYSEEGFIELRTKTALEARRLLLGQEPLNAVNSRYLQKPGRNR